MLPGRRNQVLMGAQKGEFKMQATELLPSEEVAGVVKAESVPKCTEAGRSWLPDPWRGVTYKPAWGEARMNRAGWVRAQDFQQRDGGDK